VTTVALNSVKASHSGLASAINNAFSQTAGLLAIAVLGVLMFATFDASLDERLMALELSPGARQELEEEKIKLGAAKAPESLAAAQGAVVDRAIDEAYVTGYRTVMLVAAATSLASAVSAALLIEGKRSENAEGARGRGGLAPGPSSALDLLRRTSAHLRGIRARTRVPSPGALCTSSVPPRRSALSCIERNPR
jgi:hypothetical protein